MESTDLINLNMINLKRLNYVAFNISPVELLHLFNFHYIPSFEPESHLARFHYLDLLFTCHYY